jgi:glutamate formiminotransferase/glutamate formiminotransferase/formiminotetrahydrofolate cyclodeaminase
VSTTLLAIPNVSEGRDHDAIGAIAAAFDGTHSLLDVHTDPDHHRSVFTIAGTPGTLAQTVLRGAATVIDRIDLDTHDGIHPRVGGLDVAPIVFLDPDDRGAACAEALVLADLLGHELKLPVFLYGILADGRTRAEVRRGGSETLRRRMHAGELTPDFGPHELHPTAGAVLVGARQPLIAFNVELAPPATLDDAKRIAALIRDGGDEGLENVRAIGLWLEHRNIAQVSTNVEDHRATPLRDVVEAIARHARPAEAELVGLAPQSAFDGFPDELPVRNRRILEDALVSIGPTAH